MYYASLNSGSNGNCYYVGNDTEAVLIDAGISCKETEKRLRSLGLQISKIKAIFVSHEHIDHIKGVEMLCARYSIPVYITEKTIKNSHMRIPKELTFHFRSDVDINIGEIKITPFQKYHDAADPHSFVIECKQDRIGVFTDIGAPCENIKKHFKRCHAAFLEANYDCTMLENGKYPNHLKKRISGNEGHLSNDQALEIFTQYKSDKLRHLLLSHLSKENNTTELVKELFIKNAGDTLITVASRYTHSELFCTGQSSEKKAAPFSTVQLDLFA